MMLKMHIANSMSHQKIKQVDVGNKAIERKQDLKILNPKESMKRYLKITIAKWKTKW